MKLIILDRDGVINYESREYIKSPEEWEPIPGSLHAIARLTQAGFKIAIATNQSGLSRGLFDEAILEKIHNKLIMAVTEAQGHIDLILHCPHRPEDNCQCRKPNTLLLQNIAEHFQCDITKVPMIGDSYRDIEAAWRARLTPILVKTGNGVLTLSQYPALADEIAVFPDLAQAVDALLGEQR